VGEQKSAEVVVSRRLPYTSKNGSASLVFQPRGTASWRDLFTTLTEVKQSEFDSQRTIDSGVVDIGKKLRPHWHGG
jgi:hypothetical protein